MTSKWRRRSLQVSAAVLTSAAVFLFGFLAGRVGRSAEPAEPGVLDAAAAEIRQRSATEVSTADLQRVAIEAMLDRLGDRYASYFAADDFTRFQELLDGRYSGVGLWLGRRADGAVEVVSVLPASPAATAGILVKDEVVSVSGTSARGRDVAEVVTSMRGAEGTSLALELRRAGALIDVTLQRAAVTTTDVVVDDVAPHVGRIQVTAFTRGVGRQVREAADALRKKNVAGIVLDLRGNPGGLLAEGVEVASVFLDGGTVVSYQGRGVEPEVYSAVGRGDTTTSLVVLVDGGTASAAEVVAGALQDRGRAVVVGSPSYGKGSVQQPIRLPDGSAVEITVATYRTPAGRSLDGTGIVPDVDVLPSADGRVALNRAIDILAGIVADAGTPRG